MTDQALMLAAVLLPFAGAAGILLCDRWPNLREAVTLLSAGSLGLIVITLYRRMQDGATLALQLAEPLPGRGGGAGGDALPSSTFPSPNWQPATPIRLKWSISIPWARSF